MLSSQVTLLINELAASGESELGIKLDEGTVERLLAYSRSVADFPTAVKEVDTPTDTPIDTPTDTLTDTPTPVALSPSCSALHFWFSYLSWNGGLQGLHVAVKNVHAHTHADFIVRKECMPRARHTSSVLQDTFAVHCGYCCSVKRVYVSGTAVTATKGSDSPFMKVDPLCQACFVVFQRVHLRIGFGSSLSNRTQACLRKTSYAGLLVPQHQLNITIVYRGGLPQPTSCSLSSRAQLTPHTV